MPGPLGIWETRPIASALAARAVSASLMDDMQQILTSTVDLHLVVAIVGMLVRAAVPPLFGIDLSLLICQDRGLGQVGPDVCPPEFSLDFGDTKHIVSGLRAVDDRV